MSRARSSPRTGEGSALALAPLLAGALLSACGGSSREQSAASTEQKAETKLADLARCMREHGVKLEASAKGGGIQIQIHGHPGSKPNPESPSFQQAQATCQKLLPTRPPSGGPG